MAGTLAPGLEPEPADVLPLLPQAAATSPSAQIPDVTANLLAFRFNETPSFLSNSAVQGPGRR